MKTYYDKDTNADLIKNKKWSSGKKILIIHTGGLQGIEGMNQKLSKKKWPKITI